MRRARTWWPGSGSRSRSTRCATLFPEAFGELERTVERLERHYRDVQDIEFTVEQGRLYILQTRSAKRTAAAAVQGRGGHGRRGADRPRRSDRADRARRSSNTCSTRCSTRRATLRRRRRRASPPPRAPPPARPSSTPTPPRRAAQAGEDVVLVRWETSPDDIHGLIAAKGILTAHGGIASHAAVVARGHGQAMRRRLRRADDRLERGRRDDRRPRSSPRATCSRSTAAPAASSLGAVAARARAARARTSRRSSAGRTTFARLGVHANADTPADARRRARSAPRGSGCAGPSTCSSATSGCRSSRR